MSSPHTLATGASNCPLQFKNKTNEMHTKNSKANVFMLLHRTNYTPMSEHGMLTLRKQRSTIDAAISAPNPPVIGASWLT